LLYIECFRLLEVILCFFGPRPLLPLLLLLGPPFFPVIHFLSTTMLTGLTDILHMQ
jgi:hypothetical protein